MVMIYPFMVCGSSSHLYRIWVTIIPNSEYRILVNISANIMCGSHNLKMSLILGIFPPYYLQSGHIVSCFFHNVKSTIKSAYSSKSNCVPTNSGKNSTFFSQSLLTSQGISDTPLCVFNFYI